MAQRILRPLSYGDLFDELFDLYKRNFLLLAGIAGIVYIPAYALSYAIGGVAGPIVAVFAVALMQYIVLAATTWAVSRAYLGESATIADSYKAIGRKLLPFIGTMIATGLLIGVGFMLCVVPGIIFSFWYAFISEVYVIEGRTSSDARARSKQLAIGEYGRIFLIALLCGILVQIVTALFTAPLAFLGPFMISSNSAANPSMAGGMYGLIYGVVTGLAMTLAGPIQVIAFVLLYYDIRVRKEGFDVEMLAQSMGVQTAVSAPVAEEVKPVE